MGRLLSPRLEGMVVDELNRTTDQAAVSKKQLLGEAIGPEHGITFQVSGTRCTCLTNCLTGKGAGAIESKWRP